MILYFDQGKCLFYGELLDERTHLFFISVFEYIECCAWHKEGV